MKQLAFNFETPALIQVWEYSHDGRTLLGEYREKQYAVNRANNRQREADSHKERIWIQAGDYVTTGEFTDRCEFCVGTGKHWRHDEDCENCKGRGFVYVVTDQSTFERI